MLRLASKSVSLNPGLQRSYGWFSKYHDRLLYLHKGVLWQERYLVLDWNMVDHVKSEILKTWKCCKIIYKDGVWLAKKHFRISILDERIDIKERLKMSNTKIDLLKMIPFSFFIIVPGAELTLPLCLYLFPNMIPSTFISKTKAEKSIVHLLDARNIYADALYQYMLKRTSMAGKPLEEFNKFLYTSKHSLNKKELLEYHSHFAELFKFAHMDDKTLLNVCRLLTMEPWTGFKVFGRMIFDPYYKIKGLITKRKVTELWAPDNFVTAFISKYLLLFQLKSHLNRIREDDYLLITEDMTVIDQETIITCCRQRAIETEDSSYQEIMDDITDWVKYSTYPLTTGKASNEFMVLTQIFPYLMDEYHIDQDKSILKPSDERQRKLKEKILMNKLHNFNEKMVYRILDTVRASILDTLPKLIVISYIEKLKQTLDEKSMPDDEEQIREVLQQLESLPLEIMPDDELYELPKPRIY